MLDDTTRTYLAPDVPLVSPPADDPVIAALDEMIELLSDRQRWIKRQNVKVFRERAPAYCLLGAANLGAHSVKFKLVMELARTVDGGLDHATLSSAQWAIAKFNDHPRRRHADVLSVLRRTRDRLANEP